MASRDRQADMRVDAVMTDGLKGGGVTPPVHSPLIAKGRTAEVYAWKEDQVLKLLYAWCPAAWIEREVEIARRISATSLPTPKLLGRLSLAGRHGILYERIEGPSMLALITRQPWRLPELARQLAELHADIHRQSGAGLIPLRSSLEEMIVQAETLPQLAKEAVLNALGHLPDGAAVCHGDYHPGQVMLTARGPMLLDWMTARQGDPAADVARTRMLFTFADVPDAHGLMRWVINLARGALSRQYLDRYLELQPHVSQREVETWMIPIAAARLAEGIPEEQPRILKYLEHSLPRQAAA